MTMTDATPRTANSQRILRLTVIPCAFVATVWLGALLGVSFLATPVKFQAPSLDLPTALEVGRVTFALFSKMEWTLCALLFAVAVLSPRPNGLRLSGIAVLAVVLAGQALWLLPVLDARVSQIIAGAAASVTSHHFYYVAGELLKAALLLALSVEALRALAIPRGRQSSRFR